MIVKDSKEIAWQWVMEEASKKPAFAGAYFIGSINWMLDDAPYPLTSDVDVQIVFEGSDPPDEHRKFHYQGVILEVSYIPRDDLQSPDAILGNYPLACHFTRSNIIADPTSQLTKIQETVSREYTQRKWVYKRCEHARDWTLTSLQWLNESEPFHDQVFAWLYSTAIPTHILLMAGLKNPTVRKCFVASREVLASYDHLQIYDSMLDILGSTKMSQTQAELHLGSLTEAFDIAKEVVKTPFFFSTDISDIARPAMIDGSKKLIESGYHREAVYWIAVVFSWCQKILYNDAPEDLQDKFTSAYKFLLSELGISSFSDLQKRNEQNRNTLPAIWSTAEAIIAANPNITD